MDARIVISSSPSETGDLQLGLISSAWAGTPVSTERGIELTKSIGFDSIDIFADPLEIDARERRLIRQTCQRLDLPVASTVCVALGLPDFNKPVRDFHSMRAKQYLDFCYELEGKNLLLVLGEYIWQREVITPKDQWNWAVDEVRKLGEYAAALGLEIAVELEPFHLSLVNSVDRMAQFLADVAHPAVKANVDISHLVLAKDSPEQLEKLAGKIAHVHLSDCDGRVHGDLPPGRGVVDFPPYLRALEQARFTGAVSIELEYSPEPGKIVDWVAEAYQATDRLMNEAGVRHSSNQVSSNQVSS